MTMQKTIREVSSEMKKVTAAVTTEPRKTGAVAGFVIAVRPHPGGQRIWLADVDAGTGRLHQIVWGGQPILSAGHTVPVALPGTWLGGRKMRRRSYRGQVSEGMLCSLAELGWDDTVTDRVHLLPPMIPGHPLP
jgi:tRNA-binding EMAP/Myf-like protein